MKYVFIVWILYLTYADKAIEWKKSNLNSWNAEKETWNECYTFVCITNISLKWSIVGKMDVTIRWKHFQRAICDWIYIQINSVNVHFSFFFFIITSSFLLQQSTLYKFHFRFSFFCKRDSFFHSIVRMICKQLFVCRNTHTRPVLHFYWFLFWSRFHSLWIKMNLRMKVVFIFSKD